MYIKTKLLQLYKQCVRALRMILAPPFCAYCKTFLSHDGVLCHHCADKVQPVISYTCVVTKTKHVMVFAISDYKDPIRRLILAKGSSTIAVARQLGELMWHKTAIQYIPFDVIVPVPLHWRRYARRGYNQAAEMAQALAYLSGKPVIHALRRQHTTQPQAELSHELRQENVKDAFCVRDTVKDQLKNKRVLLVDDLFTTGATVRACAKELFACKPESMCAVVASRVI